MVLEFAFTVPAGSRTRKGEGVVATCHSTSGVPEQDWGSRIGSLAHTIPGGVLLLLKDIQKGSGRST